MPKKSKTRPAAKSGNRFKVKRLTRHDDLPASVGLVKEVRSELLAQVRSVHKDLGGKIVQMDGRITQLEGKMDGRFAEFEGKMDGRFAEFEGKMDGKFAELEGKMDGKFLQVDGKFAQMDAKFEQILAVSHRTQALMEEQRSENRIVLDGLKSVMERQDRAELQAKSFQKTLDTLVSARNRSS